MPDTAGELTHSTIQDVAAKVELIAALQNVSTKVGPGSGKGVKISEAIDALLDDIHKDLGLTPGKQKPPILG
ncbi:MAG: hypothetical protein M3437_21165 [Chloroflexota bacterium]|nr:hypothetical protein [Chloroflexota bacterium]MDQ5864701.1 hypothetical protein [Chloroflexota bacterium]